MKLSSRCKDITGQRFGKLLILSPNGYNSRYEIMWNCKCDCGNECIRHGKNLRNGKTDHCGCETYNKVSKANTKNLTGKRFERLICIKNTMNQKNGCYIWECICDCGKKVLVSSGHLGSGNNRSCGCLKTENSIKQGRAKRLPNKQGLINALYGKYKLGAGRRNYSFDLDVKDFKNLISQNCFYCASEPSQIFKSSTEGFNLIYNGIDRVNNNLGYSKNNVVTCCKVCNTMKLDLSFEDFIKHIKKISDEISNISIKNGVEQ